MLFQTNNFIIAHVVNPASVTDFSISYKYFGILSIGFNILTLPFWSATTDAFYRKDYQWIQKTINLLNIAFVLAILGGVVMWLCSPWIYKIWLHDMIKPAHTIMGLVFFYYILSMRCSIYCRVINGIGKIKLQFFFTLAEAILHIPLAYWLGKMLGVTGVLISMCLMTLINAIWEPVQVRKLLLNTATGIWNK